MIIIGIDEFDLATPQFVNTIFDEDATFGNRSCRIAWEDDLRFVFKVILKWPILIGWQKLDVFLSMYSRKIDNCENKSIEYTKLGFNF